MSNVTSNEPVLSVSFVTSAIIAVIGLITAFGLDVSPEQTAAIIAVGAIVVKTIGAVYARSQVTPVNSTTARFTPGGFLGDRGAFSVLYAASIALGFLAIAFAVALLTGLFASPVGWVGVVVLAALAIFLYILATRQGTRGRVV